MYLDVVCENIWLLDYFLNEKNVFNYYVNWILYEKLYVNYKFKVYYMIQYYIMLIDLLLIIFRIKYLKWLYEMYVSVLLD